MAIADDYRKREESITLSSEPVQHESRELLTLNIGPHHPATHGVLRLIATLEGEVVRDVKPIIGYVHTGIEKTAEDKAYWKVIPVVERMDYVSYYFNAMAYCGAVEDCLGSRCPRAPSTYGSSTSSSTGSCPTSCGSARACSTSARSRCSGTRSASARRSWICSRCPRASGCTPATSRSAASSRTSPRALRPSCARSSHEMPTRADQYADLLEKNQIVLERLRDTCIVDEQTLLGLGVTGPLLRATGNPWDLRKAAPYSSYDHFDFKIPVGSVGDNYDRYRVRHAEFYESVKIISQALDGLPEGPFITPDRKVALPPRHELATSMEALIHHFKLVTEGFRVPPGEAYYPIEGPRGELGCFVRADGSAKPARVHMRDPSFVNLQALAPMVKDSYIADLIATLAMLDPILGGIDR